MTRFGRSRRSTPPSLLRQWHSRVQGLWRHTHFEVHHAEAEFQQDQEAMGKDQEAMGEAWCGQERRGLVHEAWVFRFGVQD